MIAAITACWIICLVYCVYLIGKWLSEVSRGILKIIFLRLGCFARRLNHHKNGINQRRKGRRRRKREQSRKQGIKFNLYQNDSDHDAADPLGRKKPVENVCDWSSDDVDLTNDVDTKENSVQTDNDAVEDGKAANPTSDKWPTHNREIFSKDTSAVVTHDLETTSVKPSEDLVMETATAGDAVEDTTGEKKKMESPKKQRKRYKKKAMESAWIEWKKISEYKREKKEARSTSYGIKEKANETLIKTSEHLAAKENLVQTDESAVEDGKVANLTSDKTPTDNGEIFSKDTPSVVTQDLKTTSVKPSEDLVMETATAGDGVVDTTGEKKMMESPKKGRKRYKKKAMESPWIEWKKVSEYRREMKDARSIGKANSQATVQLVASANRKVDGGQTCLADKKKGGTHSPSTDIQTSLMKSTGDGPLRCGGPVLQVTPETPQIIVETNVVDSEPQTTDEQRLIPTEAVKEEDLSQGKLPEETKASSRMFPKSKRPFSLLAHYGITPHRRITTRRAISAPSSESQGSNADWKVPVTYKKTLGHKRRKSQQSGILPFDGPSSSNAHLPEKDLTSSDVNESMMRQSLVEHNTKDQGPSLDATTKMTTYTEVSEADEVCTTPQIDVSNTLDMISVRESTLQEQSSQDQVPAPGITLETPTEEETEAHDVSTPPHADAFKSDVQSVVGMNLEEQNSTHQDPSPETTVEAPKEEIVSEAEDVCTIPQTTAVNITSNITSVTETYLEEQNTVDQDPSPETTTETPAEETVSKAEDVCSTPQTHSVNITSYITPVNEICPEGQETMDQDSSPETTSETPTEETVSKTPDVCTSPQTHSVNVISYIKSVSEKYLEEQNTMDQDPSAETTVETMKEKTVSKAEYVSTTPQTNSANITSNITSVSENYLEEQNTMDQDPSPETTIETKTEETVSEAEDVSTTPQTNSANITSNITSASENYLEEQNTMDQDPSLETTIETTTEETFSKSEDIGTTPQTNSANITSNITSVSENYLEEQNTMDQDPSPGTTIETPTEETVSEAEDVSTTPQTNSVNITSCITSVSENYQEEQNTMEQDPSPGTTVETPTGEIVTRAEDIGTTPQTNPVNITSNVTSPSGTCLEEQNIMNQDPSPETTIETPTEEIVSEAEDACTMPQTYSVNIISNITSLSKNYQKEQNTMDQDSSPESNFEAATEETVSDAEDVCTTPQIDFAKFISYITSVNLCSLEEQNTIEHDSSTIKAPNEIPDSEDKMEEQNTKFQASSPDTTIETARLEVSKEQDVCTPPQTDDGNLTANLKSLSEFIQEEQNTLGRDQSAESTIRTPINVEMSGTANVGIPQTCVVTITTIISDSEDKVEEQNTKFQVPSPDTTIETARLEVSKAEDVCTPSQTGAVNYLTTNLKSLSDVNVEERNTMLQDSFSEPSMGTPNHVEISETGNVCKPQTYAVDIATIISDSEDKVEEQNTKVQASSPDTTIETARLEVSKAEDVCTPPQTSAVNLTTNLKSLSEFMQEEQITLSRDPSPESTIRTPSHVEMSGTADVGIPQTCAATITTIVSDSENRMEEQNTKFQVPSPDTTTKTARLEVSKAEHVCTPSQTGAANLTTNLKSLSDINLEEQNTMLQDSLTEPSMGTPNHVEISETGNVCKPQTYAVDIATIISDSEDKVEEQNTKVQASSPDTTIETARLEVSKAEDVCTPPQTSAVNLTTNLKSLSEFMQEEQITLSRDPSPESTIRTPSHVEMSGTADVGIPQTCAATITTIVSDSENRMEEQNTKFQVPSPDTTTETARLEVSKAEHVCTPSQTGAANLTTNLKSLSDINLEEQNTMLQDSLTEPSMGTPNHVEISETGNVCKLQTYAVDIATMISDSEDKVEEQNTKVQASSPDTTIETARLEVSKAEDVCTPPQTSAVNLTTNLKSLSDINVEEQNTMLQDSLTEPSLGTLSHVKISETGNVCTPQTYAVNITTITTSDSEIKKDGQSSNVHVPSPDTIIETVKMKVSEAADVYRPPTTDVVNITSKLTSCSEIKLEEQINLGQDPPAGAPIVLPAVEEVLERKEVCTPTQTNAVNITSVTPCASEDNLEEQNTNYQDPSSDTTMETPTEKIVPVAEVACISPHTDAVRVTLSITSTSKNSIEEQNPMHQDPSLKSTIEMHYQAEISEEDKACRTHHTRVAKVTSRTTSVSEDKMKPHTTTCPAQSPDNIIETSEMEVSETKDPITKSQGDSSLSKNIACVSESTGEEDSKDEDLSTEATIETTKEELVSEIVNICKYPHHTSAINITSNETPSRNINPEKQNVKDQDPSLQTIMETTMHVFATDSEDVCTTPQTDTVNFTLLRTPASENDLDSQNTKDQDPSSDNTIQMPAVEVSETGDVYLPSQTDAVNKTPNTTSVRESILEEYATKGQDIFTEISLHSHIESAITERPLKVNKNKKLVNPHKTASESTGVDEILGEHREYVCKSTQTDPVIVISLSLVSDRITKAEDEKESGTIPEFVTATNKEPGVSLKSRKNVSIQLHNNVVPTSSTVIKVNGSCLEEQNINEHEPSSDADAIDIAHPKHTSVADQLSETDRVSNPAVVTTVRVQNTKRQDPCPKTAIVDDTEHEGCRKDIQNTCRHPQAYTVNTSAELSTISGNHLDSQSNEAMIQSTCTGDQQEILSKELSGISADVQAFTQPPLGRKGNTNVFKPPAVDETLENITSPSFKGDEVLPFSKTTPESMEGDFSERSDTHQTPSSSYQEIEENMQPELQDVILGSTATSSDCGLNKKQLKWLARRQRQKAKKRAAKEAEKARAQIGSTEAVEDSPASPGTIAPPQTAEMMTTSFDVNMPHKDTQPVEAEVTTQPSNVHKVPVNVSVPHVLTPPSSAGTITCNNATLLECDSDLTAISSEERKRLAKIGRRKRAKARKRAAKEAEVDKTESGDVENASKTSLSSGTATCALPTRKTTAHSDGTTTQDGPKSKGSQVTLPLSHGPEVPNITSEPKVQYPLSSEVNTNQISTKTDTTSQDSDIDCPVSGNSMALRSTDNILDSQTISQLASSEHDTSNQFVSVEKDSSQLDDHTLANDTPTVAIEPPTSNAPCTAIDVDQTVSSKERKRLAKIGRRKRAKAKKRAAKEAEMDKAESGDVDNAPKRSLSSVTTTCALQAEKTTHHPDITTTQDGLKTKGGQVTLPLSHGPEVLNVTSEPKVQYPLSSEVNTNQMSTKTGTTSQDSDIDCPVSGTSMVLGSTDNILDSETASQLATSEHYTSNQFVSTQEDPAQLDDHTVANDTPTVAIESPTSHASCTTIDVDQTVSSEERRRLAKIGRRKRAKAKKHAIKEAEMTKAEIGGTEAIGGVACTPGITAYLPPAEETTGSNVSTTFNQTKPNNTEETDPPSDLPEISTNTLEQEVLSIDHESKDTDVKLVTCVLYDPAVVKSEVSAPPAYSPGVTINITQVTVPPPLPSSNLDVKSALKVDTTTAQCMVNDTASQNKTVDGFTSDTKEVLNEITKPSHSISVEPSSSCEPSNDKSVGQANLENASESSLLANTEPLTNSHSVSTRYGSFQSSDQVNANTTLPPGESPTSNASSSSRWDSDLTISVTEKKKLAKMGERKKAKARECGAKEEAEMGSADTVDTEAAKEMLVSLDETNALPVEMPSNSIVNTVNDNAYPEPKDGKVRTPPSDNHRVSTDNSAEPKFLPLPLPLEVNPSLNTTKCDTTSQCETIGDPPSEIVDEPAEVTIKYNLSHSSSSEIEITCSELTQSTPLCDRDTPDDLGSKGASLFGYDSVPKNQHTVTLHGSFQPDSQVTIPDTLHSNLISQTTAVPGSSGCDPDLTVSLEERRRLEKNAKRKRAKARKREAKKADMTRDEMVEQKTVKEIPPSSDIKTLTPTTASTSNPDSQTGLETEVKNAEIPTPSAYEPKVSTNNLVPGTAISSTSSVVSCDTKSTKTGISPKTEAINEPASVKPDVSAKVTKSDDLSLSTQCEVINSSESSQSTNLCDRNIPDVLGNKGASPGSYDFVPNNRQAVTLHDSSRPNKQATVPNAPHSKETSLRSDVPSSSRCGSNQTLSLDERRRLAKKGRKKRAKARKRAAQAAEMAAVNNTRESTPSHNTRESTPSQNTRESTPSHNTREPTPSSSEEIILNFDDGIEFKIDWEAEKAKPFYNTTEIYPPRVPIPKWAEWDFSKVGIIMWLVVLWGIHQCNHWPRSVLIVMPTAGILLTVFITVISEIKDFGLWTGFTT